ncbi:GroES (chaperonin 10)-like protein [Pseudocohnilembus persalinus]|uniref:GroES (Chaperonin 10)-like protein n=1 Tax=Pseudocohnilembus persalinus TaxID=266149 RepID=A0A0V0QE24_PSEPJ|nr:GroES (chaperonin 10)-like protein [Pseudocohnilembus persalinus]|eukprot:KRX00455.1 GroES (chaperonin 10)-like protein [Pseudocohnilembus persalinus]
MTSKSAQLYKHQPDLKKADAVAWVLTEANSKLEQYPFEFYPLKEDEIRGKILYTGLCQSDCHCGREKWYKGVSYPFCGGHEIVAQVTKVGASVKDFQVGQIFGAGPQRNYCENCDACQRGEENLCEKHQGQYDPHFGGYSTHCQVPARLAFHIPEGMPLEQIPPLLCAGMTVWAPIKRWYDQQKEKKGLKVGVFGIGGLGHLALQFLNKLGLEVTAFTTSTNRNKELQELGAHHIAHSTDPEKLKQSAYSQHMIVNTLFIPDSQQFGRILGVLKKGGHLIQVGIPDSETNMIISPMQLVFNQISIDGSIVANKQATNECLEFAKKHAVYPICEQFPFDKFPEAFDLLENGRPKFRACVNVTDWAKQNGFDK